MPSPTSRRALVACVLALLADCAPAVGREAGIGLSTVYTGPPLVTP